MAIKRLLGKAGRLLLPALCIAAMCGAAARAQTDAKGLEHAWKGKLFGLRNFSADPVVQYRWVNRALTAGPVSFHSPSVLRVDSVKLKNNVLTIAGIRTTLVIDAKKGTPAVTGGSPIELEVDLGQTDPATVLPLLSDALFFPNVPAIIDAVPEPLRTIVPDGVKSNVALRKDKPFIYFADGEWKSVPKTASTVWPKVVKQVEPLYTEKARGEKFSGTVTLALRVTHEGKVEDVWLLKAVGMGLDEKAEEAVRQYVFAPAQVDGTPVDVILKVEVNFQII
jgi:TonB family protein